MNTMNADDKYVWSFTLLISVLKSWEEMWFSDSSEDGYRGTTEFTEPFVYINSNLYLGCVFLYVINNRTRSMRKRNNGETDSDCSPPKKQKVVSQVENCFQIWLINIFYLFVIANTGVLMYKIKILILSTETL